jgi:uncharacterized repeat protein (TIGR02543 family)
MRSQTSRGTSIRCRLAAAALILPVVLTGMSIFPSIARAANPRLSPEMTVTFYENDNPSDGTSTYQINPMGQSADLTLFEDLSTAFSNPGYAFAGWNTAEDGSGTSYADGAPYSFGSGMSLYAQWNAISITQTVTFYENASNSDTVSTYEIGSSATDLTLFADLDTAFSKPGYTFAGWNTAKDGSGTPYADGALYSFNSGISLYAQWTPVPTSTVAFNDNGGAGTVSSLNDPSGTSISLPSGVGLTLSGYTFTGWNTTPSGSGIEYEAGQSFEVASSETLYAQWAPESSGSSSSSTSSSSPPPSSSSNSTSAVTISFVANGGSGSLESINGTSGANLTLPSSSSFIRVGYTLTSWNTEANGKGTSYKPGSGVDVSTSETLYAQWTSTGKAPAELYGAIGDFAKNSTVLSASLKRQVRALATALKARHYTRVKLYGYSAATGLATLDRTLSSARASSVAGYLRVQLSSLKVTGVTIEAAGEGSITGKTSPLYSRVEVFVS